MTAPAIFRIEEGVFALALVDTGASGYDATWQAPAGARFPDVEIADYEADSTSWVCQVFSSALTASPNVTTNTRRATFCEPPAPSIVVGESSFSIELGYFQDLHVADGLSAWLFEHRTKEAFFLFGANADDAPRAIGRVRINPGSMGGEARTDLEATATFPLERAPDIEAGNSDTSRIIRGDGLVSVATAGTPGTWSPAGASLPATLAALQASGIRPSPTTAWTVGQSVELASGADVNWNGTAWEAGVA